MAFISEMSPDGGTSKYKIKDKLSHVFQNCSTARNTLAKTVSYTGFELYTGVSVWVRFTDTGTTNPSSGNITLNVNGTGAKEIILNNSNKTKATYNYGGELSNNQCHEFVYDGTNWVWTSRNTNTTNSAGGTNKENTKMFLVGVQTQANVTSYSNSKCYIGSDNEIYSNGKKVNTEDPRTCYVQDNVLYVPSNKGSVSDGVLILT